MIFKLIWKNRWHLFPTGEKNDKFEEANHFIHQCILDTQNQIMVVNDGALQIDQNSYTKILNIVFERILNIVREDDSSLLIKIWSLDKIAYD